MIHSTLWLLIGLLALAVAAVFSTLRLSLVQLVRTRLMDIAEHCTKPTSRRRVERILEDVDGHALAVAAPRIAANIIFVVAMMFWLLPAQTENKTAAGDLLTNPSGFDLHLGLLVLAVAVSFATLWLVCLVLPSSIAQHAGEQMVFRLSSLIRLTYILTRPVRTLIGFVDEIVRRLAGSDKDSEAEALEAELLSVVEEGLAEGQFDEAEQDMIEAVVEFRTTTVEEIMTPRTEIHALEYTDDLAAILAFVRDCGHSRIPVYKDNLDHIQGLFYAKDLLHWMSEHDENTAFVLMDILREAVFVPETKTVRQLMAELLAQKVHVALVIDEYGGTAGLVTIEDIVEEIFGEIHDEYESPESLEPEIVIETQTRRAVLDTRMHINDANDALEDIDLTIPENDDYDTVGGFVTVTLGRIPKAGERFGAKGLAVEILKAEPTRVVQIALTPTPHPSAAHENNAHAKSHENQTTPDNNDHGQAPHNAFAK